MSISDSPLLSFYRGRRPDDGGRYLRDVQTQSLDDLETVHDYIQWLFPLPEPSSANPQAPTLSSEDIAEFKGDQTLRRALMQSFAVMLAFYGLEVTEVNHAAHVRPSSVFSERRKVWLRAHNHNFLRISRILRCLTLLGCERQAMAFYEWLSDLYRRESATIGNETFEFWTRSCRPTWTI